MGKALKLIGAVAFALNIAVKSEIVGALIVLALTAWLFIKFFGAVFEELERRNGV